MNLNNACCQLCELDNRIRDGLGPKPLAVRTIAGIRICEKHLRLLKAIAGAAWAAAEDAA